MTDTITAEISFGIVTTPFYATATSDFRTKVKTEAGDQIRDGILAENMISAAATQFVVPSIPAGATDRPSVLEAAVTQKLQQFLTGEVDDETDTYTVADRHDIVYIWVAGIRHCEHTYYLNNKGVPWFYKDEYGQSHNIVVRLRW